MKKAFICLLLFFSGMVWGLEPVIYFNQIDGAGFFSVFQRLIAVLDAYENGEVGGAEIDFGTTGLYYDETMGPNWWGYYFEPLPLQIDKEARRVSIVERDGDFVDRGNTGVSRSQSRYLIDKYIKVRPKFLKEVELFIKKNMKGSSFIGVHYRGTDKMRLEACYLSVNEAVSRIKQKLLQMNGFQKGKIFVATDDQSFLDLMKQEFGNRVCCFEMKRSTNNQPIHMYGKSSGYMRGKMALLDCLVLSKSSFFFRTGSNLSNSALLLNPSLPSLLLNSSFWGDREDLRSP